MDVSEFLDCMQDVPQQPDHTTWQDGQKPSNGPVYYLQSQNDNFHSAEFEELLKDIPNAIDFASAALDKPPDAVNFWLGNSRSTTSFHRDPYENIYHVVAGTKRFLL